ncbi:hypothetical protein CAL26_10105 [Bordetella genomosp. 9]|uniref:CopC domain-containing protein n=1 Tax=Bordetella genomosp. 9 TaxID=1416803 RepID=A0A261RGA7_9BORD|nr:copper homeostasis periplasmic binding protein CopC [Bordetella genomosp. 9]OZI24056.1 hypothetical protein CAL26_10105 [Bordetella genomosp. 9]
MKSLLAAAVLAIAPLVASAHAHFASSEPARDAVVSRSPTRITLTTTEGLEAAFSSLTLVDSAGKVVRSGPSSLDPGDDKTLVLPLSQALPAGTYTVQWQALSKDGHKTQGAWSFTLKD